jgi:type VI secretion system protein VasD
MYRDDEAVLGETLVDKEELTLLPGQARRVSYTLPDEARFLGAAAQYQQLESTQWHAVLPIPANTTSNAVLRLDRAKASFSFAD